MGRCSKSRGLTKTLRRLHRRRAVSFEVAQGGDPRADRPERLRQEHHLQLHRRHAEADRRLGAARRRGDRRADRRIASAGGGSAAPIQIPRPFRGLSLLENVDARGAITAPASISAARRPERRARDALRLVELPDDPHVRRRASAPPALKKLELARALATQPKLLLADESLGGLDTAEMDQAADMLERIRGERGITIVWVEHIMGVLMRVVDRCVVLDHGEVIAQGTPAGGAGRCEGRRGLSRPPDAGAMSACWNSPASRRLRRLPGAVRRQPEGRCRRGGRPSSDPTAPARPRCCASSPG